MLCVNLLGAVRIEQQSATGETVPVKLTRRKAVALLAYLAVNRQPVSRETLAALLWEDSDTTRGLSYVRNAVWTVNSAVDSDPIIAEDDLLMLHEDVQVDVALFRAQADDSVATVDILKAADALYRDEFMAGFALPDSSAFEEWLFFTREMLRQTQAGVLERLINGLTARRDFEGAVPYARRLLVQNPLEEGAHCLLMRVYAWAGQFAAAHRQYEALKQILADEFDATPSPETEVVFRSIQARDPEPPESIAETPPAKSQSPRVSTSRTVLQTQSVAAVPVEAVMNLPNQTTPFVGRHSELSEIAGLIQDPACRLLTLIGPGGVGKTRLAIEGAREASGIYTDGVCFVPLAPVSSSSFLTAAIMQALPVDQYTEQANDIFQLINYLTDKSMLLVLDNFEHILDAAPILSDLLHAAPRINLLVTSRERLHLHEEWLFDTGGLDVPENPFVDDWRSYGAVRLFERSAQRVRRDFDLQNEDRGAVVHICQMVDGMPLGVELAATWVQLLSCAEIAREIQNNLDFLSTLARNVPERHHSLRAVFEHSWTRLNTAEQTQLSQLSPFYGSFTLEAAQTVARASLPVLLSLVGKSLVRRTTDGRFEIHELIRQYAAEKLAGEALHATYDRYCEYYARFVEDRYDAIQRADQATYLDEISSTMDNLRSVWYYAVEHDRWDTIRRMQPTIVTYYVMRPFTRQNLLPLTTSAVEKLRPQADTPEKRLLLALLLAGHAFSLRSAGHMQDIDNAVAEALALLDDAEDSIYTGMALMLLIHMHIFPGRTAEPVEPLLARNYRIFNAHNHKLGLAYTYNMDARVRQNNIEYRAVRPLAERALELFRDLDMPWGMANTFGLMGTNAMSLGDRERAEAYYNQAIPYLQRLNDPIWLKLAEKGLSKVGEVEEPTPEQLQQMEELANVHRITGNHRQLAWMVYNIGWTRLFYAKDDMQFNKAVENLKESNEVFHNLGDYDGEAWSFIFLAQASANKDDLKAARRYIDRALDVLEGIRFPWGRSGACFVLGNIELQAGNMGAAYQQYHSAVKIAHDAQSTLQVLRHLSGMADWLLHNAYIEEAVTLATFVDKHRISEMTEHRRAEAVLVSAGEILDDAAFDAAANKALSLTLNDVVGWIDRFAPEKVDSNA